MTEDYRLQRLTELIKEGKDYVNICRFTCRVPEDDQTNFLAWHYEVNVLLKSVGCPFFGLVTKIENDKQIDHYDIAHINDILGALIGARRILETQQQAGNGQTIIENSVKIKEKALNDLINTLSKFPLVIRQLCSRHNGRGTLVIEDEYDVQDLLHALLKIHFDDIREEEWTPSYAGGSSRMDFLLKDEQIVIEVKKTRNNLGNREVGEQLIIDKEKYSKHPDCKTLVCFVYDPDTRIKNPIGLENDLRKMSTGNLSIVVKVEQRK